MTAEIVIMNKEAIALASDSAVTMTGESDEKIFSSANKLFTLSKYHPVGIMIYGSANFMDVPWETIIKVYRNDLGEKKFNMLEEYANDFIKFLDNGNPLFPDSVQERYLRNSIYAYFNFIKDTIKEKVDSMINKEGRITGEAVEQIVSDIIEQQYKEWDKTDNIPSVPRSYNKAILGKYEKFIDEAIEEVFQELPISRGRLKQLKKIAASLFSKFPEGIQKEGISGIVVAGFGEGDAFPSVKSFHIEGIVNNKLKYKEYISSKTDFETSASIIPFAQREMVDTFMEGIDPTYRDVEESYLSEVFDRYAEMIAEMIAERIEGRNNEGKGRFEERLVLIGREIVEDLRKKLEDYRNERYVSPITSVVSMLPKDELAVMAETLVNLTSFKRKVTMESETVGGPIDVAVISKGDGFIWIKRKHYFKAELNPQFFANYYKSCGEMSSFSNCTLTTK
jgi:hypothetical protein